jgi:hypothetical protein
MTLLSWLLVAQIDVASSARLEGVCVEKIGVLLEETAETMVPRGGERDDSG